MNSIEVMVEEHKNITRMLKVIREVCYKIFQGADIPYDDFDKITDFVRNYADAHHHGKEEKFLFKEMADNLGALGNKLVTNGMLVEHDMGRLYIRELNEALSRVKSGDEESKLDVVANAVSYTSHMERHIKKEDQVVYTFAEKKLPAEVMERVNKQSEKFEIEALRQGKQDFYRELLEKLENKYLSK